MPTLSLYMNLVNEEVLLEVFFPAVWSHNNQLSCNNEGLALLHTGRPRNVMLC